jgi:hypothetical protein
MNHADWIQFSRHAGDADILRIAALTGEDRFTTLGRAAEWIWWLDHNCTSSRTGISVRILNTIVGWFERGRPVPDGCVDFGTALRTIQPPWIAVGDDGLVQACKFQENFGTCKKLRDLDAKRKRRDRCQAAPPPAPDTPAAGRAPPVPETSGGRPLNVRRGSDKIRTPGRTPGGRPSHGEPDPEREKQQQQSGSETRFVPAFAAAAEVEWDQKVRLAIEKQGIGNPSRIELIQVWSGVPDAVSKIEDFCARAKAAGKFNGAIIRDLLNMGMALREETAGKQRRRAVRAGPKPWDDCSSEEQEARLTRDEVKPG